MISRRIQALAEDFWEEVGKKPSFPRDLECAILYAKPTVAIIPLAQLSPALIRDWLVSRRHSFELETPERQLDGCFYADRDVSFIFVRDSLSPEYHRLVVAHEFGHYLAHYEAPRRRIVRRLDAGLLAVLDGERLPMPTEQISATLTGVRISSYLHFMDRTPDGALRLPVSEAERMADGLALELIAPWRAVFAAVRAAGRWPGSKTLWHKTLMSEFGLPGPWAEHYADCLLQMPTGRRTFTQSLGL
jgi:hypothetical protein